MCGLAGYALNGRVGAEVSRETLVRVTGLMTHRGPDDAGTWFSPDGRVGLASGGTSRETYQAVIYEVEDDQANASDELPFGSRGGIAVRHTFPVDAEYEISVRLRRNGYDFIVGSAEPHQIEIRIDGRTVKPEGDPAAPYLVPMEVCPR